MNKSGKKQQNYFCEIVPCLEYPFLMVTQNHIHNPSLLVSWSVSWGLVDFGINIVNIRCITLGWMVAMDLSYSKKSVDFSSNQKKQWYRYYSSIHYYYNSVFRATLSPWFFLTVLLFRLCFISCKLLKPLITII